MTTSIGGSYPSVNTDSDATINGLTVGKGGGAVSTNTAVGTSALASNTSGDRSVAIGYQSATANTTGINTSVGYQSLYTNTTGTENTAVGFLALNKNTTGNYNAGLSDQALYNNTTGSYNVAVGMQSLAANTTASNNTAVGYQAGYSNTTNANSTFVGFNAGKPATGASNTIIGAYAGTGLTTGGYNTFVGALDSTSSYSAGSQITTGSKNTIIGAYSGNNGGLDIRTASNNIVLSDGDGNPRGSYTNIGGSNSEWLFSQNATPFYVPASEAFQIDGTALNYGLMITGTTGATFQRFWNKTSSASAGSITLTGSTSVAYNTSSDYRLKNSVAPMVGALNKVMALKPVTYKWNFDNSDGEGFIAHELAEVCPQAVTGEKDGVDERGEPKYQGIDTSFLVATLTAAIQELKAEFDAYRTTHP